MSSGCNALVVPFQQLLQGPIEVLLCECVNDLRHRHFHLLNSLITTASELREWPKVTGSKFWTIGRLRNCLDVHFGQIVCDKDRVVDWCIVLVEMPLIWRVLASSDGISSWTPWKPQYSNPNPNPLANQLWCSDFLTPPTTLIIPHRLPAFLESFMLKPQHSNPDLNLTHWSINSGVLTSLLLPHPSPSLTDSLPSLNLLYHSKTDARLMQDGRKAVWSISYVSVAFFQVYDRILLHIVVLKCPHVQIVFLKFTSCDDPFLVGCIPIAAVAVHLKLKS